MAASNRPQRGGRVIRAGMRKLTILLGLSALLAMTTAAQAEDKKAASSEAKDAAPIIGADGVRRDPKGVKGISPYIELIVKGDHAYVARDFDGAIAAYRDAIKAEPEKPLAHYRLGCGSARQGRPERGRSRVRERAALRRQGWLAQGQAHLRSRGSARAPEEQRRGDRALERVFQERRGRQRSHHVPGPPRPSGFRATKPGSRTPPTAPP